MNIHGYKRSAKRMTRSLREEQNKPLQKQNIQKIERLKRAKADCLRRIRELKRIRDSKRTKRK